MVTPADIKLRFPEFTLIDDARIQLFIDDAILCVNSKCHNADITIAYLTAHYLSLATNTDSGNANSVGQVASESVGDVSVSYGISSSTNDGNDYFKSTQYGQRYLTLKSVCVVSPIIA